jgi:hypothetical protein
MIDAYGRRQLPSRSLLSFPMRCPMLSFHRHVLSRVLKSHSRPLASVADTVAPTPYLIFDRYAKVLQKDRSALPNRVENSRTVDYLRDEIADRLTERMLVSIFLSFSFASQNTSHAGYQAKVQYRT